VTARLVYRVAEQPARRLERRAWQVAAAGVLVLLAAGALGRAAARPLWHDELFTLYIAQQGSVQAVWNALGAGVDLNPPLYHVLAHWAVALLGPTALAVRLPAVLGFVAASFSLWFVARAYVPPPLALLAALVPSLTGAYIYAYEARPYGLVLGTAGVAWAAWEARERTDWRGVAPWVCAAALACAIYTHYFGVLVLLPLAAGELVRAASRRRVDWTMCIAIAVAAASTAALLPLMRSARSFAPTFWSRPAIGDLVEAYTLLLAPFALIMLTGAVMATLAGGAWTWWRRTPPASRAPRRWDLPLANTTTALMFMTIPIAGYLLAVSITGAFHERYVLPVTLGFSLLVPVWWSWSPSSRLQISALVAVCALSFAARQAGGVLAAFGAPADPLASHRSLLQSVPPDCLTR
jgi:hypothetical protein